jgi:hypothetical protein
MNNWVQVFGTNKLLWFFPIRLYLGQPKGNGIEWNEPFLDEKKITYNSNVIDPHMSNYGSSNRTGIQQKEQGDNIINKVTSLSSLYNNYSNFKFNNEKKENMNATNNQSANSTTLLNSNSHRDIATSSRLATPVPAPQSKLNQDQNNSNNLSNPISVGSNIELPSM